MSRAIGETANRSSQLSVHGASGTHPIKLLRILRWLHGEFGYWALAILFFLLLESVQEGVEVFMAGREDLLSCGMHFLDKRVFCYDPNPPAIPMVGQ